MSVVSYAAGPVTLNTQDLAVVDASAAPVVVNLPAVASASGRVYRVKKVDATANALTLTASGAETIDGSNTQALTSQYDSLTVVCDGSEWHII
jgi:hypothetical protein